ncbi:phasin family protein [Magnetovibrio sp.]|uniref:phasin family protein n=1 Tax=Magnetovibrio sp. TaxID=2024836 RepID=UPI002F95BF6D
MSTAKKKADPAISAIDAVAENFEATADMIKDGLDAAIKAGTEQNQAAKAFEGMDFPGRENFDAAVKAGEAYVAGFQELNGLFFQAAKAAVRFNSEAAKTLSACKTPEELTSAQSKLVKAGFETAVETSTTIGQTALKVAGDVSAPLSGQFGAVYNDFVAKTAA